MMPYMAMSMSRNITFRHADSNWNTCSRATIGDGDHLGGGGFQRTFFVHLTGH